MRKFTGLFTSESVSEGHPDKVADYVADCILDDVISKDPSAHCAVEVMTSKGVVIVGGEIRTYANYDVQMIVRRALTEIGYTKEEYGISAENCCVLNMINIQSPDINAAVNVALEDRGSKDSSSAELGAGDQGFVFGGAVDETEQLMPLPITIAHDLMRTATKLRKSGELGWARPDMKSQVTIEYKDGKPVRVDTVVIAIQHSPDVDLEHVYNDTVLEVIYPVLQNYPHISQEGMKIYVNSSGRFVVGGPAGDTGVTGRKIIVDTYGGYFPHGGGAISGKDITKVDRTGQYMARYMAKNFVASGVCKFCQVQIAYAIGKANPVSILVSTEDTGIVSDRVLTEVANRVFDARPSHMIAKFNLRGALLHMATNYGQFGKSFLPWEQTDMASEIRRLVEEYCVEGEVVNGK